ncbi:MAG: AbrB/MazE/SpoVT family DNA-binding domain-containing protein [Alphaproteobacteria bacterium]|jgi:putative addiction module antidote|nr:AbrB/MazE/SpoVT family DNA-binding domain-containing protein [Alphaproteobacteria bacterium]MDP6815699.1 AbrB/MazE/SpoVT family DNA-binding domain-containing protein [Alphaproteobacteria bacterium]
MELKLRKIGDALVTIWPKELLDRLNVKEGDKLHVVETSQGMLVTPHDPKFVRTMTTAKEVMIRDREALKELAE